MLKGKKVLLRPVKKSDLQNFMKWYNDQEITQYLSMYLPMTEIGEEKWIEEASDNDGMIIFVIEAISNNLQKKPIGSCGLHKINWKDRSAEFGVAIGEKEFWSNGYGTETAMLLIDYGFMQLNLHRISSGVFKFNERSQRLHIKLGFTNEGCSRKEIYKNGEYWDKIDFGILKEEWGGKSEKNFLKSQQINAWLFFYEF